MPHPSIISYNGKSTLKNTQDAVNEAMHTWPDDFQADILWVYYSPCYDAQSVADAVKHHCPNIPMLGCSTAGEWLNGQWQNNGLVMMGMRSDAIAWTITGMDIHQGFQAKDAQSVVNKLLKAMPTEEAQHLHVDQQFVITLIDGQSSLEEVIVSEMNDALQGVALVGGSAADGMDFQTTTVMSNHNIYRSGVVFAMAYTKLPFKTIAHQHFQTTDREVVVTKVSPCGRKIYALDGLPAQERYQALLNVDQLDGQHPQLWMKHPLLHRYEQDIIVHSVGGCCEQDGIWLFNAVEEGMILSIGQTQPMQQSLEKLSQDLPYAQITWVFNCLWRTELWHLEKDNQHEQLSALQDSTSQMIGFDGYGEQYRGLHHNQSLTFLMLDYEWA